MPNYSYGIQGRKVLQPKKNRNQQVLVPPAQGTTTRRDLTATLEITGTAYTGDELFVEDDQLPGAWPNNNESGEYHEPTEVTYTLPTIIGTVCMIIHALCAAIHAFYSIAIYIACTIISIPYTLSASAISLAVVIRRSALTALRGVQFRQYRTTLLLVVIFMAIAVSPTLKSIVAISATFIPETCGFIVPGIGIYELWYGVRVMVPLRSLKKAVIVSLRCLEKAIIGVVMASIVVLGLVVVAMVVLVPVEQGSIGHEPVQTFPAMSRLWLPFPELEKCAPHDGWCRAQEAPFPEMGWCGVQEAPLPEMQWCKAQNAPFPEMGLCMFEEAPVPGKNGAYTPLILGDFKKDVEDKHERVVVGGQRAVLASRAVMGLVATALLGAMVISTRIGERGY